MVFRRFLTVVGFVGSIAVGSVVMSQSTLTIGQSVDPPTLDPFDTTAPYISVFAQICEPLMFWDSDDEGSAYIRMHLAESYEWLDETTLRFHLRDGIQFTNGEQFDAAAAKFSLELLFSAFNYSQWLEGLLDEVRAVDDNTVDILLAEPAGFLPSVLAMGSFQVAPTDHQTRGADVFNQSPVCTGPWLFGERVRDDHITLVANDSYWRGTPSFDQIVYRIIPDDNARMAALEAGEIDIAVNIPLAAADRIERNAGLQLVSIPSLRQFATFFDTDNPNAQPLHDVRVRMALNLAVDRVAICEQLFSGRCTPMAGQFLTSNHSGFNPNLEVFPFDPDRARALIAEAGYPNGFSVEYTYTVGRYPQDRQAGEATASYLRGVGLQVTEKTVDFPEWARQFDARPRETTALYTVGFLFGQDGYLALLGYVPGARFRTSIMPQGFDDGMARASRATSESERVGHLQSAMAAINAEPFAIYLYALDDLYGVRAGVEGFKPRPDQTIRLLDMLE